MARRVRDTEQLALDERHIDDPEVEAALREREDAKERLGAVRKSYDEAHKRAMAKVAELELPEDTAVRVGAFRVENRSVKARSVAFETKPSSRILITVPD